PQPGNTALLTSVGLLWIASDFILEIILQTTTKMRIETHIEEEGEDEDEGRLVLIFSDKKEKHHNKRAILLYQD
ncbi:hypothetical protein ACJX0J_017996, partial [Zea mays]